MIREIYTDITNDIYSTTIVEYTNWSNVPVTFDAPYFETEYDDGGYLFYVINGEVNDAYIDANNIVVYSIVGDNHLYMFNYITYETKLLEFDIRPDQITGDGEY